MGGPRVEVRVGLYGLSARLWRARGGRGLGWSFEVVPRIAGGKGNGSYYMDWALLGAVCCGGDQVHRVRSVGRAWLRPDSFRGGEGFGQVGHRQLRLRGLVQGSGSEISGVFLLALLLPWSLPGGLAWASGRTSAKSCDLRLLGTRSRRALLGEGPGWRPWLGDIGVSGPGGSLGPLDRGVG